MASRNLSYGEMTLDDEDELDDVAHLRQTLQMKPTSERDMVMLMAQKMRTMERALITANRKLDAQERTMIEMQRDAMSAKGEAKEFTTATGNGIRNALEKKIKSSADELETAIDTRIDEKTGLVKRIVFGGVGIVLTTVFGAIVALVVVTK